jgi:hypothetical protein
LFFLTESGNDPEKVLDIESGSGVLLNEDHVAVFVRPAFKAQTPRPIFGLEVALPQIEGLQEMAIGVNDASHTVFLPLFSPPLYSR